jgi:peptidyl-prolyl cis-trans isomerase SurA
MTKTILCAALLVAGFAMTPGSARAEREKVDRIVAIVGKEVILATELASQMQMVALQTGRRPTTQSEAEAFQKETLDQMISDKLFLLEAKKDTSITVRSEEIDQSVEEQVARVAGRFKSNEEFLGALAKEGLTLRDLKKRYRTDVESQYLKQKLIQKKLYSVSVSRKEVEDFYERYKDSIPNQPEGIKLAHILLKISASRKVEDSVKALGMQLRQRAVAGEDFAELSRKFSGLGAGENGGDLGLVSRDEMVPEFSRAAFVLNPGDISGVIRTQFGYHVIKCEERQGDKLRLRHIMLAVSPTAQDSAAVRTVADSLITVIKAGGDFSELAKTFSDDNETRAQGGELGWFALTQLPGEFTEIVKDWKSPGEFRGPVLSAEGYHIVKLLDYQPEKKYNLTDDFDRIKDLARQDKTGKMVDKWLDQIKSRTFLEYRLQS